MKICIALKVKLNQNALQLTKPCLLNQQKEIIIINLGNNSLELEITIPNPINLPK